MYSIASNPLLRLFFGLLIGMMVTILSASLNWVDVYWWPEFQSLIPAMFGALFMNLAALDVQVKFHEHLIKVKNKSPNHTGALLVRIIPVFGSAALIHAYSWDWTKVGLLSLALCGIWGMFFNPMLNDALDRPLLSIDTDGDASGEGSDIDKLLNRLFTGRWGGLVWFLFCFVVYSVSSGFYLKMK